MPTLNEKLELGAALFTQPHDLGERRVYGTATAASSNGSVSVDVGGETVTIPTVGAVAQGDEVVIQVQNGHPVAIGVRGWGDAIQSQVDETASYVWLDQYGHLRVTPLPKDQNPTTGVTIDATGTEIASDDYASVLTDDGLTLSDLANNSDVLRLTSIPVGNDDYAALVGNSYVSMWAAAGGVDIQNTWSQLALAASTFSDGATVMELDNNAGSVLKVKMGALNWTSPFGTDYGDVYPVASASNLGPVKIGDGLSVASDGTVSERDTGWVNVATGIRARVVGKMMTVVAIGYTTNTTSGWVTVGTLPASITGGAARFLACKYSDGTTRRGEISGNTLKLHQPGTAIGLEFTVTVPVG